MNPCVWRVEERRRISEAGSTGWTSKGYFIRSTMEEFEFNSFLLQISKELTDRQFQHLKFVLKGSVTSAKCEEMTEVCVYFAELQRLLLLTPTNFGVLKNALTVIERHDLAARLQEKEQYFADLFRPRIKVGDNLEQRGVLIYTFSGRYHGVL